MPPFHNCFPRTSLLAALIMMSCGHPALAADLGSGPPPPLSAPPSAWTFTFTPYGWLTALDGDITVKGRSVDINVDAFEVLGHLDAAPWMSYSEARRGPLTLYSESFYAKLGIDGSVSRSVRGLTVGADADVDFKQTIIELGAAYEVARWRSGGGGSIKDANVFERTTAVDLLAGARYWHQDISLRFDLTGTLDLNGVVVSRNRAIARSGDVDWVDPLVGVRVRHQLAPGQELVLRADVGGFDVGSQLSWNLLGAYSFTFAVRNGVTYAGLLGYRALSVDYEKGSGVNRYDYDVVQHGPVVGLTIGF
jgi:hypothetical protein